MNITARTSTQGQINVEVEDGTVFLTSSGQHLFVSMTILEAESLRDKITSALAASQEKVAA